MTRDKDLRRVVKERSARLENDAKKQNDYQERRLTKFISSMEKEHNGNMTKIQAQQKELEKKSDDLNEHKERFQHYVFDEDMFDAQDLVNQELSNLLDPPAPKPAATSFTANNLYGDQSKQYKSAEVRNPKQRKQPIRTKIIWENLTPMMMAAAQLLKKHGAQEEGVPTNGTKYHGFAANILQDGQCPMTQPKGFRVSTTSKYTLISDSCALPTVEGGQGWAASRMEKQMFGGNKMVRS